MKMMNKPYIILHMTTTVDGKITGDFLSSQKGEALCEEYYRIHREYCADAYLCGRITFEGSFTFGKKPDTDRFKDQEVESGDYVFGKFDKYAVVIDTHGRLGWDDNIIHDDDSGYDNAHIIEVLTEQTPKEYLAYLRSLNISYIICGEKEVDVSLLCEKLYELFGIKKLLLEGGGITDSLFLKDGLIDEMSIVVAPIIDGDDGINLFVQKNGGNLEFNTVISNPLPHSGLWLNYKD